MPNTYIKAEKYVALALAKLERDTIMPNIVTLFDGRGFIGAKNDTVNYKLDAITTARDYEWRTRTAPIVMDEIYRTSLSIQLNTDTYSAVPITDEELTLDLTNFQQEVLDPQMTAIAGKLEAKISTALQAAPFAATNLNAATADDPYAKTLTWRTTLNKQGTPKNGRLLVVGSNVENWLLSKPEKLIAMSGPGGAAGEAFREATPYRINGFTILQTDLVPDNFISAVHPSWAVLANLAAEIPVGATYGARQRFSGYSLRVIRDYDPNYKRDRSVVDTFTGLTSVNDQYARYVTADLTNGAGGTSTIPSGYGVGDVKITAGAPVFTGLNPRGGRGTFTV